MPQSSSPRYFESLTRDLVERSASSLLGIYGPRTDPLRAFLSQVLQRPAGHPDSFLADPAFEAIFDWQQVKPAMDDLALQGFLTEALVEAMDTKAADEQLAEYRFPMDRHAYTHQYAAWKQLKRDEPQSVLITSGTGSGKTEGFLVPILDDLARGRTKRCVKGETAYLSIGDTTHTSRGGDPGKGTPSHEGSYAGKQVEVQ